MSRFVVIVLDGFGIGAMEDVPLVRPSDLGANTLGHILVALPGLRLPTLERLGLMNAAGLSSPAMHPSSSATYGKSRLMHDGADTFFGHQEIMGTRPSKPFGEPFSNKLELVLPLLRQNGFEVQLQQCGDLRFLVVNGAATVADNIECDPGQAFNVTAALDLIDFEEVMRLGKLVRSVSTVPRVVTFGGRGVGLSNLLDAVETHGSYIGINAPRSGVYNDDYHCVHLGYGVDPTEQLPARLHQVGVPVFLLGKAADVIQNPYGQSLSVVPTPQVLAETARLLTTETTAFICANVQETDLCGHRERPDRYAEILQQADSGIETLLALLGPEDILVVMADHGNDPLIGHPHHTRERVPLLFAGSRLAPGFVGERATLSDIAATAATYFGAPPPQNGTSIKLSRSK